MNRTKIELKYSAIHGKIKVCHFKREINYGVKPTIKVKRDGMRDLPKKIILPLKGKANHLLGIGKIILTQMPVKLVGGYQMKPDSKCHWLGGGARTVIGKVV